MSHGLHRLEVALRRLGRRAAATRAPKTRAERLRLDLLVHDAAVLVEDLTRERDRIGTQIQAADQHHKAAAVYTAALIATKKGRKP